jgi:hypothetical protein
MGSSALIVLGGMGIRLPEVLISGLEPRNMSEG